MRSSLLRTGILTAALLFVGAGCVSFNSNEVRTTGDAGMFVSTDKGESWQAIAQMPGLSGVESLSKVSVFRLTQDPQDAKAIYWASRGNGLFYSYDDGRAWQKPDGPVATGFIYSVAVHPKDRCTIYATNGKNVFKSIDCNRTWESVYRESRGDVIIRSIAINPNPPHQIFLAEKNGDLLQSSDLGASWNVVRRFNTNLGEVYTDPLQPGTLYVATLKKGLFRSNDMGTTWTDLSPSLEEFTSGLDFRRFYIHPEKAGVLYWISQYGILVSEDGGDGWAAMDLINPPGSANIYGFAINPDNDKEIYYTASIEGRSTLYRSIDGGASWITRKLPSGQLPTALRLHPDNTDWLYLGFTIPPQQ